MPTTSFEPAAETRLDFWEIDPDHTDVGFEVKHLMISKVHGRFGVVRGTIAADERDYTQSTVSVDIDVRSIDTHQSQRDEHLRSADFFAADRYPRMSFLGTAIEPAREGFRLKGNLTIRGITREVVLEVSEQGRGVDSDGAERMAFSATARIDRRDFGLTWNQALESGGVLVGNEIRISLEVQVVKVA